MSQRDPNVYTAPMITLELGMSGGLDARLIQPNQAALLINTTVRGGFPRNRPGWTQIGLTYEDTDVEDAVKDGRFQGATNYNPTMGLPYLVASIGGRDFRFHVWSDNGVDEISIPGDLNPTNRLQVWYQQAEEFLIKQDGSSPVWCWNGGAARRLGVQELPVGCMMCYALGRVGVTLPDRRSFVFGDIRGSSSGTPAYGYRDSVLKMTENDYLNEGGAFGVPATAGDINAMAFIANLDTSLGQGPVEIFTENGAFSVNLPFDRTIWKSVNYPIQTISLMAPGSLSQAGTVRINGDIWYRSKDGIRSFIVARRDFAMWGNVPMSEEMWRLLQYDTPWLLQYCSGTWFDNRLLLTATPTWTNDHGVFHKAFSVLDFDLLSSLGQRSQPCWDGMWVPPGQGCLQILTSSNNGIERCFAFILNDDDQIELWELSTSDNFDYLSDGSRLRIRWGGETRLYDYGQPNSLKKLERMDIAPSEIQGEVDFNLQFRSDDNPCWNDWNEFSICATDSNCEPDDCLELSNFQKSYRSRVTVPTPPVTCETSGGNKPAALGYRHQLRMEILGPCTIKQLVLYGRDQPQASFDGCPPTNPTCTEETCCPPSPYFQSAE